MIRKLSVLERTSARQKLEITVSSTFNIQSMKQLMDLLAKKKFETGNLVQDSQGSDTVSLLFFETEKMKNLDAKYNDLVNEVESLKSSGFIKDLKYTR